MKWIATLDEMPPPNTYVLAFDGKRHIIRACFIPAFTDENCDYDGDNYDYRESDDTYWVPEGWYEGVDHWEMYSSVKVNSLVTHWMKLPEPPFKILVSPA